MIYQQTRLTKNGKKFQIYKFRTMVQNAEADGKARLASEGDPRILPIGRVLRATRLDELPQIYNILKGDMSIVGPRPERPGAGGRTGKRDTGIFIPPAGQSRSDRLRAGVWKI